MVGWNGVDCAEGGEAVDGRNRDGDVQNERVTGVVFSSCSSSSSSAASRASAAATRCLCTVSLLGAVNGSYSSPSSSGGQLVDCSSCFSSTAAAPSLSRLMRSRAASGSSSSLSLPSSSCWMAGWCSDESYIGGTFSLSSRLARGDTPTPTATVPDCGDLQENGGEEADRARPTLSSPSTARCARAREVMVGECGKRDCSDTERWRE